MGHAEKKTPDMYLDKDDMRITWPVVSIEEIQGCLDFTIRITTLFVKSFALAHMYVSIYKCI